MSVQDDSQRSISLADPSLRLALERYVRTRVDANDVDDIVQETLTDALASTRMPEDPSEVKPWLFGIARHKVADHYRRARRDAIPSSSAGEEAAAESAPLSARELLRWAEKELPPGEQPEKTLDWMLQEGQGEKLEAIAREADVPAPRIRQRVWRLRAYFRDRWARQLAAVAAILLLVGASFWIWRTRKLDIAREVPSAVPSPKDRAREIRKLAFDACKAERWQQCVDGLNEAKRLDPDGDEQREVQEARRAASNALTPRNKAPAPPVSSEPPAPKPTIPAPKKKYDDSMEKAPTKPFKFEK